MKLIETLKKKMKISLKEIKENTNKNWRTQRSRLIQEEKMAGNNQIED